MEKQHNTCKIVSGAAYQPIACGLYDQYELWAMRGSQLAITYSENEQLVSAQVHIKDLQAREGKEYMLLSDGKEIRLDRILSIEPM